MRVFYDSMECGPIPCSLISTTNRGINTYLTLEVLKDTAVFEKGEQITVLDVFVYDNYTRSGICQINYSGKTWRQNNEHTNHT